MRRDTDPTKRTTSQAAIRRENRRQQFIWTAIIHIEALANELQADPGFLSEQQLTQTRKETLRLMEQLDSLAASQLQGLHEQMRQVNAAADARDDATEGGLA